MEIIHEIVVCKRNSHLLSHSVVVIYSKKIHAVHICGHSLKIFIRFYEWLRLMQSRCMRLLGLSINLFYKRSNKYFINLWKLTIFYEYRSLVNICMLYTLFIAIMIQHENHKLTIYYLKANFYQ